MSDKAIPFKDIDPITHCKACGGDMWSMYIVDGYYHQSCYWCAWKATPVRVVEQELTEEMLS